MQEFKSKITQKNLCRKCKTTFISNDGSPCPECSKKNKELAAKREAKKKEEKETKTSTVTITKEEAEEASKTEEKSDK